MMPPTLGRSLGALAGVGFLCLGCTNPRTPVSGIVVWQRAGETQELPVSPGDVLRVASKARMRVVDVIRGPEGEVEAAHWLEPTNGVALVRPPLGVSAMRFPPNTTVFMGSAKEPEVGWFALEREALAWARAPLRTPFPSLAAAPRLDPSDAKDLDGALAQAHAPEGIAVAIRSIFALRAVRTLEGLRPYPYARNLGLTPSGAPRPTRLLDERTYFELPEGQPASVTVSGPANLVVLARVARASADAMAEVRVTERDHVRGTTRARIRRLAAADPEPVALRRVFVHVPPGRHTYVVTASGAPAWVAPVQTSASRRIEDAVQGVDETHWLAAARRACDAPEQAAPCAMALALAGEDDGPVFQRARVAASPLARQVAEGLAAGAPADRAAELESEASLGDPEALARVAEDSASSVDASLRDAWWRGTLRGTSWTPVDPAQERTWFRIPRPGEPQLDENAVTVVALPWRRIKAVQLLATAPCASGEPIRLEVDGQTLTAQPGSSRALWHVAVHGPQARIRRLDRGPGQVYVVPNDGGEGLGTFMHPASPLGVARALSFPADVSAAGLEVWLAEGMGSRPFTLESHDGRHRIEGTARAGTAGVTAIDERGTRWRRVATIALPAWAAQGARALGSDGIAVRAVVRGATRQEATIAAPHAQPADVDAVLAASRRLLTVKTRADRGAAHLERALLLASYGFDRAAMDDATLAKEYGATAAHGEDPVLAVRRATLPAPPKEVELTGPAYGIEPDFDAKAVRCAEADGPRSRLAQLDATLRERGKGASFDRALAAKVASLAFDAPNDPRSEGLLTRAMSGSKWRLLRDVDGGGGRVPRVHTKEENPVIDADGRLKPRMLAGDPFGARFVSVSAERPARAFLDRGAAKARLDVLCVARRPNADTACPLKIVSGDARVVPRLDGDGRGSVELPPGRGRGKGAELEIALPEVPEDFVALIRVVLDRPTPGATQVPGVGWVLDTPSLQYRFLLAPGRPIRAHPSTPTLVRVDALAEEGASADVVISVGGRSIALAATGEARILPVPKGAEVVVAARSGLATVAIAERIESENVGGGAGTEAPSPAGQLEFHPARVSLDPGRVRDVVESSPRPPTWLEERLGTVESNTGGASRTLRDGVRDDTASDTYGFQSITYRRHIESMNLFALGGVLARVRDGSPSYGIAAAFHHDVEPLHLRLSGTAGTFTQSIEGGAAYTVQPRAFVEYRGRLTSDLFAMPRLGIDGYYTSFAGAPSSVQGIDDDVYNAFRARRNTLLYVQGLLWYAPFFNDIVYLRTRGSYDATNNAFSHASLRPGTYLLVRALEFSAFLDAQYYAATASARSESSLDVGAGGGVVVHLPLVPGSFEIRPNATGLVRDDGGWHVLAGLALVASPRRGARDYASLELAYPEGTSGGIPWRNEGRGQP
ncbi:hypothetical protein LVJ94_46375 [Pendulispora rubella]|uniref:Uncharacterized protein n=1 Tax=Pendulispora rubella TaxID=2741070 RepID=A0ABZ2L2V6_9BACT